MLLGDSSQPKHLFARSLHTQQQVIQSENFAQFSPRKTSTKNYVILLLLAGGVAAVAAAVVPSDRWVVKLDGLVFAAVNTTPRRRRYRTTGAMLQMIMGWLFFTFCCFDFAFSNVLFSAMLAVLNLPKSSTKKNQH